jgi:membrane-bound metal-dependent hydrolase YbcI (DUF457 family)
MFIGHIALGFAAKKIDARPSLATYLVACQLADVLWPVLLLLGLERVSIVPGDTAFTPLRFDSYPLSHSLLMLGVWGVLLGAIHWTRKRDGRVAALLGTLVVSHWILDFVSHRPDMPIVPWGVRVYGLGLWNSVRATIAVEIAMLAGGLFAYLRATRAKDAVGRLGIAGLIVLLLFAYGASAFGPPPPSVNAIAMAGLAGAAFATALSAWADAHRAAR